MSDYTQTTDFSAKDALSSGDPNKIIYGADLDTEYSAIETASATKANKITSAVTNDLILQSASGDLVAAGFALPNVNADITASDEQINALSSLTASRVLLSTAGGLVTTSTLTSANLENAYYSGGTDVALADGGTGSSTAAGARTNLGLGSLSTQASNSVSITGGSISGIIDLAVADGGTGSSTAAGARTSLGLGSLSTLSSINDSNWSGTDLAVVNGGTGSSTASGARTNLGLGTLAVQNQINETDIDYANSAGVYQILEDFNESVAVTDAGWTQLGTAANDIMVYVPANASNLRYVMYWRRNGAATNGQVRMYHSAHNGSTLTTTSTSLIISSAGTLDVADEAGGGIILAVEGTTGGGSDTVVVDRIAMWFE